MEEDDDVNSFRIQSMEEDDNDEIKF